MVDASDITEHIPSDGDGSERALHDDGIWCGCNKFHHENREVDRMCCCDLEIPNFDCENVCNSEEFQKICLYKPYLEIILVGLS